MGKQVSLSHCPLPGVTLKGRAVVIKWNVITPPRGAGGNSEGHARMPGTEGPGSCSFLAGQWPISSPGLPWGCEAGERFVLSARPSFPGHPDVGVTFMNRALCKSPLQSWLYGLGFHTLNTSLYFIPIYAQFSELNPAQGPSTRKMSPPSACPPRTQILGQW